MCGCCGDELPPLRLAEGEWNNSVVSGEHGRRGAVFRRPSGCVAARPGAGGCPPESRGALAADSAGAASLGTVMMLLQCRTDLNLNAPLLVGVLGRASYAEA